MDGLGNNSKATFISIIGGKFTRRVAPNTPGSVSRINKNNVEVWETKYDNFTGKLVGIKAVDSEYGKQWNFTLADSAGNEYVWTSPYSNGYSKAFLKMLPNIDLSQSMQISPSSKEVEGKTQNTVFVKQNGVVIKHKYTKDSPELPPMEKITVKGQEVWDDTKQMAFLESIALSCKLDAPAVVSDEGTHQWEDIDAPNEIDAESIPF